MFLYNQGRYEEALVKIDQAIRQMEGKPRLFASIYRSETFKIFSGTLRMRTLILAALGRYEEAREAAILWQRATGSNGPNASLALVEYYCGRLDEALAQAQGVPAGDSQYEPMRCLTARVFSMKGDFDEAIRALAYEPSDIARFYSPRGLEVVSGTPEGAKLIALQRSHYAGILTPARLLQLAQVYLARDDVENAVCALDQAEKSVGPDPTLQISYCRHRAWSLAAQGKANEAGNYIEQMRAIAAQLPTRGSHWEVHYGGGRVWLCLRRFADALAALKEAQKLALNPIEKHATAWLLAGTYEAGGQLSDAIPYYQIVAADPIPSWMRKRALEVLAQQKT